MNVPVEIVTYSVALGAAVACAVWALVDAYSHARRQAYRLETEEVFTRSPLLRMIRPAARWMGFLIGRAAARIEMRLGRDSSASFLLSTRIRVQRALDAAGRPEGLTPDEFLGLVALSALGGLVVGGVVYLRVSMGLIPLGLMCAFAYLPVYWLKRSIRNRLRLIRRMLPYAIDLLSLSVTAGLDFTEALARIVSRLGQTPLAVELGEMLRQVRLGKSRTQALRDLADRVDLPEMRSVISALIQTDELGGQLGPILRAQAAQLRVQRSQMAEKQATQAPVKILFPLIFFIFPTLFIMIFGPIALKLLAD